MQCHRAKEETEIFVFLFFEKIEYKSYKYDNQCEDACVVTNRCRFLLNIYVYKWSLLLVYLKSDFIDEHRNIHHNHAIHSTQFHFIWSIEFELRLRELIERKNRKKMFNDDADTDYTLLLVSGYSLDSNWEREKKKCKQNFSTKKMIEI